MSIDINNNDTKSQWLCDCKECNLYLEQPIALPCGYTICLEHVAKQTTKFKCCICAREHLIPEGGFQVNKKLMQQIESNSHLSNDDSNMVMQRDCKILLNEFENLIKDYECEITTKEPNDLIKEHFSSLRSKCLSHKELVIQKVQETCENILQKLDDYERECKKNAPKKETAFLNELKTKVLAKMKHELRKSNLNQTELKAHFNLIASNMKKFKQKIDDNNFNLFMRKIFDFEPVEINESTQLFGDLVIKHKQKSLSNDFGQLISSFEGHSDLIRSFQVSEQKQLLITGSNDNRIKIWNIKTTECLKTLTDHTYCVSFISLLSDETMFLSGSQDKSIKLWSLNENDDFECLQTITNDLPVYSICLIQETSNKIIFACGCIDGTINVWSMERENKTSKLKSFKAHSGWIPCMKLLSQNKLITSSSDGYLKIWEFSIGNDFASSFNVCKQIRAHNSFVRQFELIDDQQLLTCSDDFTLKLWNLQTSECLSEFDFGCEIFCIKLLSSKNDDNSNNKNLIAIGSKSLLESNGEQSNLIIFDLNEKKIVKNLIGHTDNVFCMQLLSNGNLMTSSSDKTCKLWRL